VSATPAPVEVLFLWHHHQPDYRSPSEGRSLLPWVRLHATKDYLDMARHLERHPGVRATFNFVPSLLDQLDEAAGGAPDALFDLIARPAASLDEAERAEIVARCSQAPRHALERWPRYAELKRRLSRPGADPGEAELLALEAFFLLAWIDPLFLDEPEARRAASASTPGAAERDGLLDLSRRLTAQVLPAYRALAERGQIELSASPYYHPILPLIIDITSARRARPELALPAEPFAAPDDAARQIERALARHARAFGAPPSGMWPPEGGVSPEAVELAAGAGLRWLASDEGVLWRSLPAGERRRDPVYRPWWVATPAGDVAMFFRDHELSDRIGFVYQNWAPGEAVADLLARLRRVGSQRRGGEAPPLVSIILDGENCWEGYADDGGPFLEMLYDALERAPDIRTRTPSEVLASGRKLDRLPGLHSGSWIDADFHVWIGDPEKNRAWELISRARRALLGAGGGPSAEAWEALDAACGSDWMWWFGGDHVTGDKAVFDRLFREHLAAVYEHAGLKTPAWLAIPVARPAVRRDGVETPLGFVHPILDGQRTQFYEWYAAGRIRLLAGGTAMHRDAPSARDLYYGFDPSTLYLRLDLAERTPPGEQVTLTVEVLTPRPRTARIEGLTRGSRPVIGGDGAPLPGARCEVGAIVEIALPFAALGLASGEPVELVLHLGPAGERGVTLPPDDLVRFTVPGPVFEVGVWSA
jgi:alpha-amylase/alpha-mannosidase (GH57 family)